MRPLLPLSLLALTACLPAKVVIPAEDDTGFSTDDTAPEDTGEGPTELPDIEVTPAVDFGAVQVECEAEQSVEISNVGQADLEITALTLEGSGLSMDELATPFTLAPDQVLLVELAYAPTSSAWSDAELRVESNDPDEPEVKTDIAAAPFEASDETVSKSWTQRSVDSAAVLFAMDTSCSMYEDLFSVQNEMHTMMNVFQAAGTDVRVAATWGQEDGCVQGPNPYVDDGWAAADVGDAIEGMLGAYGSTQPFSEMALAGFSVALEQSDSGDCNEDLFADRQLHLVGISDESDQSPLDAATYVSDFGSYGDAWVHGIGGPYPGGCTTASAYAGVYQASELTGGQLYSICDDMGVNLSSLAGDIVHATARDTFPLDEAPEDPATITVKVDSAAVTTGWSYDSGEVAVVFERDSVPEVGSTVKVSYTAGATCE